MKRGNMPENENIRSLLERARNGNSESFEAIYELTYGKNYRIVCELIKNEQDVQDVLQDTYIKIYQKLEQVQGMQFYSFMAWSGKVARNTALDFLRKKKRIPYEIMGLWEADWDVELALEDVRVENQPEHAIVQKELCQMVQKVLEKLPGKQRECAILFYFRQKSIREIAAHTGCSENTVKSRLHYARKKLQATLEDDFAEKIKKVKLF